MYDPNCDNKFQPPALSPKGPLHSFIALAVKRDGTVCVDIGVFAGYNAPSEDLGDINE